MLKYVELRDAFKTKVSGVKIKIQNRIERNRADEKKRFESRGTLNVEYTNNWRQHVNYLNDEDRLVFEASHRKIRETDGEYYVVNIRTPNRVSEFNSEDSTVETDSTTDEGAEEDAEEESDEEESGDIEKRIPDSLKLTFEDEDGEIDSFDLRLSRDENDEENEDDENIEEDVGVWRKPHAVDVLYLDICLVYADQRSEQEEEVQVPHMKPVVRDEFEVEDLDEAERIVRDKVERLDRNQIDSILEEAYEQDKL
jgi:flagellar biosynthesis GTPase FlhF